MLFDLIKVPQMGGDSYYFHFIDEEAEAQEGVKWFAQGSTAREWGSRAGYVPYL